MSVVEAPSIRNAILCSDVREQLRLLPDESVNCVVTSPPYWGLRDYGVEGQLGLEATPEEFVCNLVDVFREVRRVLRADGTVWLNLGDSYAGSGRGMNKDGSANPGNKQLTNAGANLDFHDRLVESGAIGRFWVAPPAGLKQKDLVGIPWRVAFALQADGWWLRSDIIWSKPNPMPESVVDRPTKSHEYIFLLSKSARYYYDAEAIKEPVKFPEDNLPEDHERAFTALRMHGPVKRQKAYASGNQERKYRADNGGNPDLFNAHQGMSVPWEYSGGGRNKRTVWEVATEPYAEAHFATFPTALVKPCILAGCPEGGIVLDPFLGSGTTALVAKLAGRDYIGIELNESYVELAKRRINVDQERML